MIHRNEAATREKGIKRARAATPAAAPKEEKAKARINPSRTTLAELRRVARPKEDPVTPSLEEHVQKAKIAIFGIEQHANSSKQALAQKALLV